jgi:hypothetical protein
MEVTSNKVHGQLLIKISKDSKAIVLSLGATHTSNNPIHFHSRGGVGVNSIPCRFGRSENRHSLSRLQRVTIFQELLAMEDPASKSLLASEVRQERV